MSPGGTSSGRRPRSRGRAARREPDPPAAPQGWTFLSNHAHVLLCLSRDATPTLRDVAEKGAAASFDLPKGLSAADVGVAVLVEDSADARTMQCIAVEVSEPAAKDAPKRR